MAVARKSFTATGEEDRRWQGLVLASSMAALVQHAASEFVSAGENVGAGEGGVRGQQRRVRVPWAAWDCVACSHAQPACARACS